MHTVAHAETHSHPTPGLYLKIAVTLFILTALEVGAYEIGHRADAPLHTVVEPVVVEILLVLSAIKFALVAMFYMHLKQDESVLGWVFICSLIIAAVVVCALMVIVHYQWSWAPTLNPKH
jgi:cytochrome c oxidase subunit IV